MIAMDRFIACDSTRASCYTRMLYKSITAALSGGLPQARGLVLLIAGRILSPNQSSLPPRGVLVVRTSRPVPFRDQGLRQRKMSG